MHLSCNISKTFEKSNSSKAASDSIKSLRPDGRFVLMRVSTTEPFTISPEILLKRPRIIGSTQNDRQHLYGALDYLAKGKVRVMAETFRLKEISNTYDKVYNGNVRFKAVIEPSKWSIRTRQVVYSIVYYYSVHIV